MALNGKINKEALRREVQEWDKKFREQVRQILSEEGQQFVDEAFNQPSDHGQGLYEDKTGDLRNSIAYYLYEYGKLIEESYAVTRSENITLLQPYVFSGVMYQLMGIAGKKYASYVEDNGFNVITAQKDALIVRLDERFENLVKDVVNGNV